MKKLLIIVVTLMLLTSAAYAAPLMDYSFGRAAFDLGVNCSPTQNGSGPTGISSGWNIDFGAAAGLGNNFAVKYSQQNMSSSQQTGIDTFGSYNFTTIMQVQQINLMYDFMPSGAPFNVSAFIGAQYSNLGNAGSYTGAAHSPDKSTQTTSDNLWGGQIGVQASTYVANSVIVYGQAQYGLPYYQFGGGVAYAVTPSFDINLSANYVSASAIAFYNTNNGQDINWFSIPITLGVTMKI